MQTGRIGPAAALAVLMGFLSEAIGAADLQVEATRDLAKQGELADRQRLPILLMFASEFCPYCAIVEEDYLKPMLISGDYEDKVIIRKVLIDDRDAQIRDFDGSLVAVGDIASRYRAFVTPTIVFLDRCGRQLSEKLVGISSRDYYGGFLDEGIEASLRRLEQIRALASSDDGASCAVDAARKGDDAG